MVSVNGRLGRCDGSYGNYGTDRIHRTHGTHGSCEYGYGTHRTVPDSRSDQLQPECKRSRSNQFASILSGNGCGNHDYNHRKARSSHCMWRSQLYWSCL